MTTFMQKSSESVPVQTPNQNINTYCVTSVQPESKPSKLKSLKPARDRAAVVDNSQKRANVQQSEISLGMQNNNEQVSAEKCSIASQAMESNSALEVFIPKSLSSTKRSISTVNKSLEQANCAEVINNSAIVQKVQSQGIILTEPLDSSATASILKFENNTLQLVNPDVSELATYVKTARKETIPVQNLPEKTNASGTTEEIAHQSNIRKLSSCKISIDSTGKTLTNISEIQPQDSIGNIKMEKQHIGQAVFSTESLINVQTSQPAIINPMEIKSPSRPKPHFSIIPKGYSEEENITLTSKSMHNLDNSSSATADALIKLDFRGTDESKQEVSAKFDVNIARKSKNVEEQVQQPSEIAEVSSKIHLETEVSSFPTKKYKLPETVTPATETVTYIHKASSKPRKAALKGKKARDHQISTALQQEIQNSLKMSSLHLNHSYFIYIFFSFS